MCRLGAVGWGAHSPRRGSSSNYNGTAAAVTVLAGVVGIVAAGVVTGGGVGGGGGGHNDRITFDATTVALSCFSLAFGGRRCYRRGCC